jgi:hypothetical protein
MKHVHKKDEAVTYKRSRLNGLVGLTSLIAVLFTIFFITRGETPYMSELAFTETSTLGVDAGSVIPASGHSEVAIDWCAVAYNHGCVIRHQHQQLLTLLLPLVVVGAGTLNDDCPAACTSCGCPGYASCSPYGDVTCTTSTSAAGPGVSILQLHVLMVHMITL